ncbi:MAG: hypothetical protein H6604_01230 [Flavobacteriales bacterium]|nr:hypothetical protein [Flavobacteriales bacterium]
MLKLNAQNDNLGIYSITIYEYQGNGAVNIDKYGNTNFNEQLNLKKLNTKINQFLDKKKYQKRDSNNNPPPPVSITEKGKKSTYISIILERDFINEENYRNKTTYLKEYHNIEIGFNDYDILELFNKKDKEKILRFLNTKNSN